MTKEQILENMKNAIHTMIEWKQLKEYYNQLSPEDRKWLEDEWGNFYREEIQPMTMDTDLQKKLQDLYRR